jgi:hypothetical protein
MSKICVLIFLFFTTESSFYWPIQRGDRKSEDALPLTAIGEFGLLRKARPGIPAHYHTGVDIKRPTKNYHDEPIFPVTKGMVISKRTDGPYAQLIVEHESNERKFWTVYEHIAGIRVNVGEPVTPTNPMARFMNKEELDRYGWQFDHFHFEVMQSPPVKLKRDEANPQRHFASYSLVCFTKEELKKRFHNPIEFVQHKIRHDE